MHYVLRLLRIPNSEGNKQCNTVYVVFHLIKQQGFIEAENISI